MITKNTVYFPVKTLIMSLLFFPAVLLADIPPTVAAYYEHIFPDTRSMNIVASATNNGTAYYQIYGEGKAQDNNTSAILSVSPEGVISHLDASLPSMDPDPCYVISDPAVWRALQANFVERQTESLGRPAVQNILNHRAALSYFMAKSYAEAGYTIPSTILLYTDAACTKLYQRGQPAPTLQ